MRWKTERPFDGKFYQEYSYQKLSNSDNWFSSYSQSVGDIFLRHNVILIVLVLCYLNGNNNNVMC